MKQIIKNILLAGILSIFSFPTFGQTPLTGSGTLSNQTTTSTSTAWLININEAKCVRITYSTQFSLTGDGIYFLDVDANGNYIGPPTTYLTGYVSGTYITSRATGKVLVVLNTPTVGNKNFTIEYTGDNSISTTNDLSVGGVTMFMGNVGIGTAPTTEKLVVNGNILVGATSNKIKLMDFPGQGSWIDMPAVSGKATGIGSGGAGVNPWLAYAGNANQWFTGSLPGDICYRNTSGKLLFGNASTSAAMAISGGNVGIGTTTPQSTLDVKNTLTSNGIDVIANFQRISTNNSGSAILRLGFGSSSSDFESNNGMTQYGTTGFRYGGYNDINIVNNMTGGTYGGINLITNGASRMSINANGNVGIGTGTTIPQYKLDVAGSIRATNDLIVSGSGPDIGGAISIINNSKINAGQASTWKIYNMSGNYGNSLQFWAYDNLGCVSGGLCAPRMTLLDNGNVGIGTTIPDALLTVNGTIHAKEVIVTVDIPADFVFKPSYKLMALHEVEQFVKANSHLPEIPSAAEITKNGMSIGDMQNKLLQKIEELTLYVIEQQKEINLLKQGQK